ncbi:MAG: ribosome-associated translation inhibitor RaiA [Victivallaceae bacterium]|nr:ribosome-associated translation inhibitor RaiA [Victivallaceae bacterium]
MAITVSGRQFEISEKVRAYVEAQLLPLHDDPMLKAASVNAVLQQEKSRFAVNVVFNCKYHVVTAKVEDFDLFKAIDGAVQKIQTQLKTLREKIVAHQALPLSEAERLAAERAALE